MTDEVIRFEYGPKNQHRPSSLDLPAPTVMARGLGGVREYQALLPERGEIGADPETGESLIPIKARPIPGWRKFTLAELRRLCSFPDDFTLTGDYQQRWERLGRAVPPLMMAAIADAVAGILIDSRRSDMALRAVGSNSGDPPAKRAITGQKSGYTPTWVSPDRPCPTIRTGPYDGGGTGSLLFDSAPEQEVSMGGKPPYRVPSMEEIRALPWNGLNAVSTFSGCGGSSLGYRMAGFRVLWASEFIPAARDSYRANAAPYTVLDERDIREVSGEDILAAIGMGVGELDLFDGSPPCASFSTAGKREAGWNKVKKYSDTEQRTDDLFYEYARLIRDVQPKVFVAENVSGLVKGTAKGYFLRILQELRGCGYRVQAKLLDAQWLGVPQARQRLIFVGVRNDLNRGPVFPSPLPYRYSVREALPWIPQQQGASRVIHDTSGDRSMGDVTDRPSPTITVGVNAVNSNHYRVVHDPGGQFRAGGDVTDRPSPTITTGASGGDAGNYQVLGAGLMPDPETGKALQINRKQTDGKIARRFTLQELRAICGFPPDFTLMGTYEQRWERLGRAVPPVMMARIAAAVRDGILNLSGGVA